MMEVFVVFYDEIYPGFGERGGEQRRIEGVYDTAEKAREMVNKLNKRSSVTYADFDPFEVE
jgi:hypothetical protein